MRIYKNGEQWKLRFSLPWEEQRLMSSGDNWIPFSIPGDTYAIGRVHARSHEIVFFQNGEPQDDQLVALEFPETVATPINEPSH
jgi:hypothetical protein